MKFNTANPVEKKKAQSYFTTLVNKNLIVEVKKISPKRSLNQNSYLHLLITAFANEFGWTIEEAKTIYKRIVNPQLYIYKKNDVPFLRSSADLSKEEMTLSIERFRDYSAENGFPLPSAVDQGWLRSIENESEQYNNKRYN